MGFRSTIISEDSANDWPQWFRDKYTRQISSDGVIFSPFETKSFGELVEDIHKALTELEWFNDYDNSFSLVSLHECGGLTKIQINKDGIRTADPIGWKDLEYGVADTNGHHGYCYDCSDLTKVCEPKLNS